MICILNIDSKHSNQVSSILKKYSINNVISNDEQKILSCDKIIIPDTNNIIQSLRKLKLMNLMSVLRLVQKPILGINQGMILMCNKICELSQIGLGLINEDVVKLSAKLEGSYSIINRTKNNKSLLNMKQDRYYFRTGLAITANQSSDSIIKIGNTSITASYSRQNIYGIQMCLNDNEKYCEELIITFARL